MDTAFVYGVIFVLAAALVGGISAKLLKLPPIIGYLVAGVVFGSFFPKELEAGKLAEIGVILLLFSVGIELSLEKISKFIKSVTLGATLQIIPITGIFFIILSLLGLVPIVALILAAGFSISSTSVLAKILSDRGETETIHGEFMLGWTLVEDLVIIPMIVLLPTLKESIGPGMLVSGARSLGISALVVIVAVVVGRLVAPFIIHKVAAINSRELLVVAAVFLALGTAAITSFFGISPALGAFLAGVVISESQENHAVFAETRPLKDLFVALFFVTLGLLVSMGVLWTHLPLIIGLAMLVIVVKFLVVFSLTLALGYHGRTALAAGIGLAQVGDLAFVFYSQAAKLNLLSPEMTSVAIAIALVTLILSPLLYRLVVPIWRQARRGLGRWPKLSRAILGWDRVSFPEEKRLENHIIICGFGRVGGWVGKALEGMGVNYIVVDYNQTVVAAEKKKGTQVIYGDPSEAEVLEQAGIAGAKAIVIAIPDRVAQEEIISQVQTKYPDVKIISRVHLDEDFEKMKLLRVNKIIQPEFEASLAMVKAIMDSMGKSKEEIRERVKSLRVSRSKS